MIERMPKTERTAQGLQFVIPGCERRTAPRTVYSVGAEGQLLMDFYAEPSEAERLRAQTESPLRPRVRQRPLPAGGLFRDPA